MADIIEEEPHEYATSWTRGADGSFNHLQKERFAIALASGKTVTESSEEVGIKTSTGLKWSKNIDMRLRKKELRQSPAISQTFVVSVAMIVADLHKNATMARDNLDFKASNDALIQIYKIAKQEKTLLETFDARVATGTPSSEIVGQLQAHLAKARLVSDGDGDE